MTIVIQTAIFTFTERVLLCSLRAQLQCCCLQNRGRPLVCHYATVLANATELKLLSCPFLWNDAMCEAAAHKGDLKIYCGSEVNPPFRIRPWHLWDSAKQEALVEELQQPHCTPLLQQDFCISICWEPESGSDAFA